MGEGVVPDQPARGGKGPPVAEVLLGGLLDEEGRDRHVGLAHDGQYLRAGGPAVVDGDVDGAPGRTGEAVQPGHGRPADLRQRRDRDRDDCLLAVLSGQLQPGLAGGPALEHGHLRRCREADLIRAAQDLGRRAQRAGHIHEPSAGAASERDRPQRRRGGDRHRLGQRLRASEPDQQAGPPARRHRHPHRLVGRGPALRLPVTVLRHGKSATGRHLAGRPGWVSRPVPSRCWRLVRRPTRSEAGPARDQDGPAGPPLALSVSAVR